MTSNRIQELYQEFESDEFQDRLLQVHNETLVLKNGWNLRVRISKQMVYYHQNPYDPLNETYASIVPGADIATTEDFLNEIRVIKDTLSGSFITIIDSFGVGALVSQTENLSNCPPSVFYKDVEGDELVYIESIIYETDLKILEITIHYYSLPHENTYRVH